MSVSLWSSHRKTLLRQLHSSRALNVRTVMIVCGVESHFLVVPSCQFYTHKHTHIQFTHTEPQIKVVCSLMIWGKRSEELGGSFFPSLQTFSTANPATKPHQSV